MGIFAIEPNKNVKAQRPKKNSNEGVTHIIQLAKERREIVISKPQLSYNGINGTNKTANEFLFVK